MSSEGALAAKARAMFGERLGADEYESLMQKKSVGDIAAVLKNNRLYHATLEGINEKAIHRGQLEVLLRMNLYHRLKKLIRYGSEKDEEFMVAATMNTELSMILTCVRTLMNPDSDEREQLIQELPLYAASHMSFDISKLAVIQSYDELLTLLKGTKYFEMALRHRTASMSEMDYVALAHDLREVYFHSLEDMAEHTCKGEEKASLLHMINLRAELENIAVIYRLKKYFSLSPLEIEAEVTPRYCLFNAREIERLIQDGSADDVLQAMERKYKRYIRDKKFIYIENYTENIEYRMYYSILQTSMDAHLILLSYLQLSMIEIRNVINIIEGVRYNVPKDKIRVMLVY